MSNSSVLCTKTKQIINHLPSSLSSFFFIPSDVSASIGLPLDFADRRGAGPRCRTLRLVRPVPQGHAGPYQELPLRGTGQGARGTRGRAPGQALPPPGTQVLLRHPAADHPRPEHQDGHQHTAEVPQLHGQLREAHLRVHLQPQAVDLR